MATKNELSADNVELRRLVEKAASELDRFAQELVGVVGNRDDGEARALRILARRSRLVAEEFSEELRRDLDEETVSALVRFIRHEYTRAGIKGSIAGLAAKFAPELIEHVDLVLNAVDDVGGFLGGVGGDSLTVPTQPAPRVDATVSPATVEAKVGIPTPTVNAGATVPTGQGGVSETSSDTVEITGEAAVQERTAVSETSSGTASIETGQVTAEGRGTFTPPPDLGPESGSGATYSEKLETEIDVTTSVNDALRSPDQERDEGEPFVLDETRIAPDEDATDAPPRGGSIATGGMGTGALATRGLGRTRRPAVSDQEPSNAELTLAPEDAVPPA